MFKYFSDILAQFTTTQKVFVLLLLLVVSAIISLGIVYIKETNKDPEQLSKTIVSQQIKINNLQIRIDKLDSILISDNQNCTDSLLSREKRYSKKMLEQQIYVNEMIENIRNVIASKNNKLLLTYDTIKHTDSIPKITEDIYAKPDMSDEFILKSLNKIQNKLKYINN